METEVTLKENLQSKFAQEDEVKFVYMKKDGTRRQARGTRKLSAIPENSHPGEGTSFRPESPNTIKYYDFDAEGWRSFLVANFVEFI